MIITQFIFQELETCSLPVFTGSVTVLMEPHASNLRANPHSRSSVRNEMTLDSAVSPPPQSPHMASSPSPDGFPEGAFFFSLSIPPSVNSG